MSVREYAILYLRPGGAGGTVVVSGGNAILPSGPHALDGPEHTAASDVTRLDATASAHGLLPKLSGDVGDVLRGDGTWGAAGTRLVRTALAYDAAGLTTGFPIYVPAVGEYVMDAWIEVTAAWDGTTPTGDVGCFSAGQTAGLFALDTLGMTDMTAAVTAIAGGPLEGTAAFVPARGLGLLRPFRFTTTDPLEVVVTQDGAPGGADPGATLGAGWVWMEIAAAP